MNELALFAGAGGGLLASNHLLGHRTRAAVEISPFCREVLFARQRDELLPDFPIWDDIETFDGRPFRGSIDVVSGGFPCQPFSEAARGRNVAPDLWPEMLRVVGEVRPRFVFAENVVREPIERAAMDLRAAGYRVPAIAKVSASAVGAPHLRPRWWVLGDADGKSEPMVPLDDEVAGLPELGLSIWPDPESLSFRVSDGLAHRMDRARAAGNGQVPAVAAVAWHLLGGP